MMMLLQVMLGNVPDSMRINSNFRHWNLQPVLLMQVMLKDIADSKRINSNIKALPTVVTSPVRGRRQDAASIQPLTSTVTSALFWPPQQQDTLKLPSQVRIACCKVTATS